MHNQQPTRNKVSEKRAYTNAYTQSTTDEKQARHYFLLEAFIGHLVAFATVLI